MIPSTHFESTSNVLHKHTNVPQRKKYTLKAEWNANNSKFYATACGINSPNYIFDTPYNIGILYIQSWYLIDWIQVSQNKIDAINVKYT